MTDLRSKIAAIVNEIGDYPFQAADEILALVEGPSRVTGPDVPVSAAQDPTAGPQ